MDVKERTAAIAICLSNIGAKDICLETSSDMGGTVTRKRSHKDSDKEPARNLTKIAGTGGSSSWCAESIHAKLSLERKLKEPVLNWYIF